MPQPTPAPDPIAALSNQLRPLLNPATELEEMFFRQIVSLTVLANFLMQHIARDPELEKPETTRRIRLLHANDNRRRYAYEELRRLQLARQLQSEDPELAAQPTLCIVGSHTTRTGLRSKPRQTPPVAAPIETTTPPRARAADAPRLAGRNSQCPCGSGRKFKHCCLGKQAIPEAA